MMSKNKTIKTFDLGRETRYEIDCPGGVIGFDLEDHKNAAIIEKMYSDASKAEQKYKGDMAVTKNKYKNQTPKKDKLGFTQQDKEELKAHGEFMNSIKNILDSFFGEGSGDKLFYDEVIGKVVVTLSRVEMLLYEILPPHFEAAGIKYKAYVDSKIKEVDALIEEEDSEVIDLDEEETE